MPVIVLAGEEEFELSRRVAELKSTLLVPPWHTLNLVKLNNPDLPALADAAVTRVLGQGKRIILVQDCDFFTKKRTKTDESAANQTPKTGKTAKRSGDIAEEDFAAVLTNVPDNTYLVFSCPHNFDSTLRLAKAVSKVAKIEEFPKEKYFPGSRNAKLDIWCRNEAKKYGATIEDAAIQYLLGSTEANLRQLSSEIEKMALAILPQTAITYKIVADMCSPHGHIFQFVDFWLGGNSGKALTVLQELLAQQNAMPVLAALQTLLSKWIKLKVLEEQYSQSAIDVDLSARQAQLSTRRASSGSVPRSTGSNSAGSAPASFTEVAKRIASELKLLPFSVEKDLRRLQKYSAANLVDKRLQLTRLEYAVKVGQLPDQHALSLLVLDQDGSRGRGQYT